MLFFNHSDKEPRRASRRIRKLFKRAGDAETADFFNNKIIRVSSITGINEKVARKIKKRTAKALEIKDKPILYNTFDSDYCGLMQFRHSLFFVCDAPNHAASDSSQFIEWNNLCNSLLGVPLVVIAADDRFCSLSGEFQKILLYNDPGGVKEYKPLFDLLEKENESIRKTVLSYFERTACDGPELLFQFSDLLYLRFSFSREPDDALFKDAIEQTGLLLTRFYETSKYEQRPRFPVQRGPLIQYQLSSDYKPLIPETYKISKEVEEIINKLSLNFSAQEKLIVFIKMAQDLLNHESDTEKLQPLIEKISKLIQYSDTRIEFSPLVVTEDSRILLPAFDIEINMQPLHKAVYILFFRHPEGILLRDLDCHREELTVIYSAISNRKDPEIIERTISELLNPAANNLNECLSRIREAFLKVLDEKIASHYYVSGERGGVKRIVRG